MEQRQKGEQFRILDPAIPPSSPAAPKRLVLMLVAVAVSAALAAGVVVLSEQIDSSFHNPEQLRMFTTVPVLLSIHRVVTERDTERSRYRARVRLIATAVGLLVIVSMSYWLGRGNEQLLWMMLPGQS